MEENEIKCLVEQIRCILLDQPQPPEIKLQKPEHTEVQGALDYLTSCLQESNAFLNHLQRGILDVKAPGRNNYLAGNLKELHSALRYLTWQANQVANGDYSQTVHFLGDFSESFNRMTRQLAEREAQLKAKSRALEQTAGMMKSVMDSLQEWILVSSRETGEIIYANQSAKAYFLDGDGGDTAREFVRCLGGYKAGSAKGDVWEHQDPSGKRTFRIKSHELIWEDAVAYSHLITDITDVKERQKQMQGLVYMDELTGLYNRRFCVDVLQQFVEQDEEFCYCMIDLDDLKYANDHFGHKSGDEYLKTVAREIRSIIRSSDIACRIGGDEFAVLLPNCSIQTAQGKMEQLDQTLITASGPFPMSVSYGVSHTKAGETISVQEMIDRADEKMYILKNEKKATQQKQTGDVDGFVWTKEPATGNTVIEAGHKSVIEECDQTIHDCTTGSDGEDFDVPMVLLDDGVQRHFVPEELPQIPSRGAGYQYQ